MRYYLFQVKNKGINPLVPGGNKKVIHTQTNLQLNAQRLAAGLFKYV